MPGLLKFEGSASQSKIETAACGINTGVAAVPAQIKYELKTPAVFGGVPRTAGVFAGRFYR